MKRVFLYNDNTGYCDTLDYMGNDLTIVNSARVSFDVTHTELESKDEKLIHYLYRNKHFYFDLILLHNNFYLFF